jgi:hypothetical protein
MRLKKQAGFLTQPEVSDKSRLHTLFVDSGSSSRRPLSDNDGVVGSDITGIADYLFAKGHSRRLYQCIADVERRM